jgi:hypothetical protein
MEDKHQQPEAGSSSSPLQILEYAAVAASVAGTAAAVATKQVVFAAAPLSLALFLNLANRRRMEQVSQHHTSNLVGQMRLLTDKIRSVQGQAIVPGQEGGIPSGVTLAHLAPVQDDVAQLQAQYNSLLQQLGGISDKLEVMPVADGGVVAEVDNDKINALEYRLTSLSSLVEEQESRLSVLAEQPAANPFASSEAADSSALAELQSAFEFKLAPLQQQLEFLGAEVERMGNTAPQFGSVSEPTSEVDFQAFAALKSDVQNLSGLVESSLASLSTELSQIPGSVEVAVDTAVEQRLSQVSGQASANPEEVEGLKAQLQGLSDHVETSLANFSANLANLLHVQGDSQQGVSEAALAEIKEQVEALNQKVDASLIHISGEIEAFPGLIQETVQRQLLDFEPPVAAQAAPQAVVMAQAEPLVVAEQPVSAVKPHPEMMDEPAESVLDFSAEGLDLDLDLGGLDFDTENLDLDSLLLELEAEPKRN